MSNRLIIDTDHLRYLQLQRGALWDYSHDLPTWLTLYHHSISKDANAIQLASPRHVKSFLDVGSGLSGVGILLKRFWDGAEAYLLDGEDDDSVVEKHAQTFNSGAVTRDFWQVNNAQLAGYFTPDTLDKVPLMHFDLVFSLQSWCFHFPPDDYLDFVASRTSRDSVLIVDVRHNRKEWIKQLERYFRATQVIQRSTKCDRIVWRKW
jgi:SAM-dependent methyltransferase